MRVLAIYRHYWPDATPYARLLKAILEEQVRQGHQVDVICGQPSYNDLGIPRQPARETIQGVSVNRVRLLPERKRWRIVRFANAVLFLMQAVWHATIRVNYDLLIANTQPPVMIGLALRLIKRLSSAEYILHAQDIHPEGALLAKDLKSRLVSRLAMASDTKSCNAALRVVTLSNDMRETLLCRTGMLQNNLVVLNNFSIGTETNYGNSIHPEKSGVFRVLFAGNLGRFQDLERVIQAIALVPQRVPIELTFMGAGSQLEKLRRLAVDQKSTRIFFEPYQSPEVAMLHMQRADLGIISLAANVYRIAYPSKTMTYLAAGCPVLTMVERESQLACEVMQHELGYVPMDTSSEAIALCLEHAWLDRKRWSQAERAELALRGEALFGKEQILSAWSRLFHECGGVIAGRTRRLDTSPPQIERHAA